MPCAACLPALAHLCAKRPAGHLKEDQHHKRQQRQRLERPPVGAAKAVRRAVGRGERPSAAAAVRDVDIAASAATAVAMRVTVATRQQRLSLGDQAVAVVLTPRHPGGGVRCPQEPAPGTPPTAPPAAAAAAAAAVAGVPAGAVAAAAASTAMLLLLPLLLLLFLLLWQRLQLLPMWLWLTQNQSKASPGCGPSPSTGPSGVPTRRSAASDRGCADGTLRAACRGIAAELAVTAGGLCNEGAAEPGAGWQQECRCGGSAAAASRQPAGWCEHAFVTRAVPTPGRVAHTLVLLSEDGSTIRRATANLHLRALIAGTVQR
eukprot:365693-Chlamydomonas_euryale.AAC.20